MTLESKFQELGVAYQRDEDGLLSGVFNVEHGRTQFFMCKSKADLFAGAEDYDFLSPVGPSLDAAKVREACEVAGTFKRGGIVVGGDRIWLKFDVPSDLDAAATRRHLEQVCITADNLERQLFGTDDE